MTIKKFSFCVHAAFIALCKIWPQIVLHDSEQLASKHRSKVMTIKTEGLLTRLSTQTAAPVKRALAAEIASPDL